MDFQIKKAEVSDMPEVLELIKELAKIVECEVEIDIYDLIRDGFSVNPLFKMFVAEKKDKIVGFSIFYKSYSSNGRSQILEDVFVSKEYKNSGIGLSLFARFLDTAKKKNIKRLEWTVLEQYKSLLKLYQKSGANILWDTNVYTMYEHDIEKIFLKKDSIIKPSPFDSILVREGEETDMVYVIDLLEELSVYKKSTCDIDVFDLVKDGFSKKPYFKTFVLEVDNKVVGVLLYYLAYSTFKGKSIILEELHVKEGYRGYGFGRRLNYEFFKYVKKNNIKRVSQGIYNFDDAAIDRCMRVGAKERKGLKIIQIKAKALDEFINK